MGFWSFFKGPKGDQGDPGPAGPPGPKGDKGDKGDPGTSPWASPLRHRMYPEAPKVYQDIFEARDDGAIVKLGNPQYNDTSYVSTNLWRKRTAIQYGKNNEADGNGARVIIPEGYDTLWVRVFGNRWNVIKAYFLDGDEQALGLWSGGWRSANCYGPDGSLSDSFQDIHQWLPIPAGRAGQVALIAKPYTNELFWLSGLAFSKNPWAHAAQSAKAYAEAVNGGDRVVWNTKNWHADVLAEIIHKGSYELRVPVVPSGRDKLLYLIAQNNDDVNGCAHTGITVNDVEIERFLATYDNPFARHWNSRTYQRYIAARIPAALIADDTRLLSVRIDMSKQNAAIRFREIGTHDLDIPTIS